MYTTAQYPNMPSSPLDSISAPAPVYTILIIGMVLFMASNVMPSLLPDPSKIGYAAAWPDLGS